MRTLRCWHNPYAPAHCPPTRLPVAQTDCPPTRLPVAQTGSWVCPAWGYISLLDKYDVVPDAATGGFVYVAKGSSPERAPSVVSDPGAKTSPSFLPNASDPVRTSLPPEAADSFANDAELRQLLVAQQRMLDQALSRLASLEARASTSAAAPPASLFVPNPFAANPFAANPVTSAPGFAPVPEQEWSNGRCSHVRYHSITKKAGRENEAQSFEELRLHDRERSAAAPSDAGLSTAALTTPSPSPSPLSTSSNPPKGNPFTDCASSMNGAFGGASSTLKATEPNPFSSPANQPVPFGATSATPGSFSAATPDSAKDSPFSAFLTPSAASPAPVGATASPFSFSASAPASAPAAASPFSFSASAPASAPAAASPFSFSASASASAPAAASPFSFSASAPASAPAAASPFSFSASAPAFAPAAASPFSFSASAPACAYGWLVTPPDPTRTFRKPREELSSNGFTISATPSSERPALVVARPIIRRGLHTFTIVLDKLSSPTASSTAFFGIADADVWDGAVPSKSVQDGIGRPRTWSERASGPNACEYLGPTPASQLQSMRARSVVVGVCMRSARPISPCAPAHPVLRARVRRVRAHVRCLTACLCSVRSVLRAHLPAVVTRELAAWRQAVQTLQRGRRARWRGLGQVQRDAGARRR